MALFDASFFVQLRGVMEVPLNGYDRSFFIGWGHDRADPAHAGAGLKAYAGRSGTRAGTTEFVMGLFDTVVR
ncbi:MULTISPECIES: hypothetical protein [Actinomadura]|uniref:Uncharacterized protein n=1 Tax=Actinomadura yumaensis TaxID=111807 RepID=A0ABW2CAY5_9ACTN|nr:hypothetical protein [Actinomadura sp. J1-007]MWK33501.1 hypothetical protein [Actinomadura sp. J1-007]